MAYFKRSLQKIIGKAKIKNTLLPVHFITLLLFLVILFLFIFYQFPSNIYAGPRVPFILPLDGKIIVRFRQPYRDEEKKVQRQHTGIDIAGTPGDDARASGNGIVSYTGFSPIGGRTVVIKHNEKIRTTYLNLSAIFVTRGLQVAQGESIGKIGAFDDPSSPVTHLHFGVIYNGKYLDPEDLLNIDYDSISRFISLEYIENDFILKKL